MSLYSRIHQLQHHSNPDSSSGTTAPIRWTFWAGTSGLLIFHQIPAAWKSGSVSLKVGVTSVEHRTKERLLRAASGGLSVTTGAGLLNRLWLAMSGLPTADIEAGSIQQTIETLDAAPARPAESWVRQFFRGDGTLAAEMATVQSLYQGALVESTPLLQWPVPVRLNVHLHTEAELESQGATQPAAPPEAVGMRMHATGFSVSWGARDRWRVFIPRALCPVVEGKSVATQESATNNSWLFDVTLQRPAWMGEKNRLIVHYWGSLTLDNTLAALRFGPRNNAQQLKLLAGLNA